MKLGLAVKKGKHKFFGKVGTVGKLLFTTNFLFPFEALSVLLLVAIVGAVIINRRAPRAKGRAEAGAAATSLAAERAEGGGE